ncbi:MAG TPA: hypothetical protein VI216_14190 [Candidatus Acidoferrales bacterium]
MTARTHFRRIDRRANAALGFGLFWAILIAYCCVMMWALAAIAEQRVHLTPNLVVGEVFRYQIDFRTTTTGTTTTPLVNPEGGSRSSQTIHLLVRLDVLGASAALPSTPGGMHIRATFEKSSASSESDALDPSTSSLASRYARMEGRSVEFTLAPDGQLTGFKGLKEIFAESSGAQPIISWLSALSPNAGMPTNGVRTGEKWKSQHPLQGQPLSDLLWRTESTYLRNEPCDSPATLARKSNQPVKSASGCAVILTHFEISRQGSPHSDATPEDYRRNGLRTSGTWLGSGEALETVSLATGLLVSSTQTSKEDADYEIASVATGSRIHEQAHVQSQSEITLVAPPELPARPE